jgi:hypothetical protein
VEPNQAAETRQAAKTNRLTRDSSWADFSHYLSVLYGIPLNHPDLRTMKKDIFDKDGKVVGSSGKLGADSPTPPSGVFDRTKQKNDDIFTWQPQKGVRIAAVLRKADGDKGFVLVGRNLREIERRTEHLIKIVGVAWVGLLVLSALLAWALSKLTPGTNLTLVEENIIVQENSEGSELV